MGCAVKYGRESIFPKNPDLWDILTMTELEKMWEKLSSSERVSVPHVAATTREFPDLPGVYCIWEKDKLCYVGETSSLRGRMGDIQRTLNHTFRRKVGKANFSAVEGYKDASSGNKFPPHIEEFLNGYIMENARLSYLPVDFGRKELEEYICHKYKPQYNSLSRRNPTE